MTEQLERLSPPVALTTEHLRAWTELNEQRARRTQQLAELATAEVEAAASKDETRRELTRALLTGARQAIGEIEAALLRLQVGAFGICERCASTIARERLDILPMSRFCTPCQRATSAPTQR